MFNRKSKKKVEVEKSKEKIKKTKSKKSEVLKIGKVDSLKKLRKLKFSSKGNKINIHEIYENGLIKIGDGEYSLVFKSEIYKNSEIQRSIYEYVYLNNLEIQEVNMKKQFYVILKYKMKSKKDDPFIILYGAFEYLKKVLSEVNLSINVFLIKEILDLLYKSFNPIKSEQEMFLLPKDIYKTKMSYIVPNSYSVKTSLIESGAIFRRVLFVRYMDEHNKEFEDRLLDSELEIATSKHIKFVENKNVIEKYNREFEEMTNENSIRKKKDDFSTDLIEFGSIEGIVENKNIVTELELQKYSAYMSYYISIYSEDIDELEDKTKYIKNICQKAKVKADILTHKHADAMASILPIGNDKANIKMMVLLEELLNI